jgi:regulator of protease activity HflC (stomatin/prohibitin superfamily)
MSLFTFTLTPGQCLLEQRPGRPSRALEAGKHPRHRDATYVPVDLRERLQLVVPQDVLTADGVSVKVTAVIRWAVSDAARFVEHAQAPLDRVYLAVQVALRDALAGVPVGDALATARGELVPRLTEAAAAVSGEVGIDVRAVVVKDVLLPADLRAAYADVVTGAQRAKVQLDQARAETAALRSLANAAKLLDDHPALAKLRLVQALPAGSKLELTVDGG